MTHTFIITCVFTLVILAVPIASSLSLFVCPKIRTTKDCRPKSPCQVFFATSTAMSNGEDEGDSLSIVSPEIPRIDTRSFSFDLIKDGKSPSINKYPRKRSRRTRLRNRIKSLFGLRKSRKDTTVNDIEPPETTPSNSSPIDDNVVYHFTYDCDVIELSDGNQTTSSKETNIQQQATTTGVLLIHPIGVGIGRWYYERLINKLQDSYEYMMEVHRNSSVSVYDPFSLSSESTSEQCANDRNFVVAVPDLLGSATGCNVTTKLMVTATTENLNNDDPTREVAEFVEMRDPFPLFNISDWTEQIWDLMNTMEREYPSIDDWAIVANGGCSPIALQVAAKSVEYQRQRTKRREGDNNNISSPPMVRNIVLSSVPRLPFFLSSSDPGKVASSYKKLCGWVGRLFWWYACRNKGQFIQDFSEKNLVSNPSNLGDTWQSNCYETAISYDGRSRYSTFSFLAGALQDGCVTSLDILRNEPVQIDIIKSLTTGERKRRPRSWFWQRKKKKKMQLHTSRYEEKKIDRDGQIQDENQLPNENDIDDDGYATSVIEIDIESMSLGEYIELNGNGGRETTVDGRISVAHEDPMGYADAMMFFLCNDDETGKD